MLILLSQLFQTRACFRFDLINVQRNGERQPVRCAPRVLIAQSKEQEDKKNEREREMDEEVSFFQVHFCSTQKNEPALRKAAVKRKKERNCEW
jgi:hypothetical protein